MANVRDRYLELLKKCLLHELYIEDEARIQYLLLALAGQSPVREEVLRDIAKHRPQHVQRLIDARGRKAVLELERASPRRDDDGSRSAQPF